MVVGISWNSGAVRAALAASPWLVPGADETATIVTSQRLAWALRVAEYGDDAARIAAGRAAVVAADRAWRTLSVLPRRELTMVTNDLPDAHYRERDR